MVNNFDKYRSMFRIIINIYDFSSNAIYSEKVLGSETYLNHAFKLEVQPWSYVWGKKNTTGTISAYK